MRRYTCLSILMLLALVSSVRAQPITDVRRFVLETRANLEFLANAVAGEGVRPEAWTFNVNDVSSPTFIADLWFDLEQIADQIYGAGVRPEAWNGAPATSDAAIAARNIRHDLELAADQQFGAANRPDNWRPAPPLVRCDRAVQNLAKTLDEAFNYNLQTPDTTANYCNVVAGEVEAQVLRLVLATPEAEARLPDLILAVRGDLERLADEEFGVNIRPEGWKANKDKNSPTLLSDIFLDLDTLANTELGLGRRPPGWIGLLPNAAALAYRNLRHDLELLANELGRVPRPRGWQGVDPLAICDPMVQNLAALLAQVYGFSTAEIPLGGGFCRDAALAANQLAEQPPALEGEGGEQAEADRFVAQSQYAFSYLDPAATQYMGVMPPGTRFKAWYRNFGESTMMFVSGQDFAVFVDLRWTTLPPEIFQRLPTLEGVKPLTFCDASWCNGPGPTPTPTGAGAIAALLNAGTPQAAPSVQEIQAQKTQVSWNNIRVTYLLDNPTTRTAQVTLEICTDTSQTVCEPVLKVFDNALGAPKPVLSQFNGLNVYEFPYGYSSNLIIEGATLFSPDVWISDPTIR